MTSIHVFWVFAAALTLGALLPVLQPLLAWRAQDKGALRRVPLAAAVLVPALALAVYLLAGRPGLIGSQARDPVAQAPHPTSMPQLIQRLEARVREQPRDASAAILLARSYYAAGRFDQALPAFERAFSLNAPAAAHLADYADALAAHKGGGFDGQAQQAVERALALDASHVKSLWLAGSFAFNDGRPGDAMAYWKRLEPLLPAGSEESLNLQGAIAQARARLGQGAAPAAAGGRIAGAVSVAAELRQLVRDGDTLYVFARALQGPPMPLAVFKASAGRWPAAFVLDESMAVMGGSRLGDLKEAVLVARISHSGQAIGQPGDLESGALRVAVGAAGVRIAIDKVRQ